MIPVPTYSPLLGDHLSGGRMPVSEIDRLYLERMKEKEAALDKSRFIGEVDLPECKSWRFALDASRLITASRRIR